MGKTGTFVTGMLTGAAATAIATFMVRHFGNIQKVVKHMAEREMPETFTPGGVWHMGAADYGDAAKQEKDADAPSAGTPSGESPS